LRTESDGAYRLAQTWSSRRADQRRFRGDLCWGLRNALGAAAHVRRACRSERAGDCVAPRAPTSSAPGEATTSWF